MSAPESVCVIGAGAAGLAATRDLVERGVDVVTFEKSDRVGGHWNHDYEALHLITSRDVSHYRGFPMPADYPLFPSRDQVRDYLAAFADAFALDRHIRFNTGVEKIEPVGDCGIDGWRVTTSDQETRIFGSVIVANGHLWDPAVPELPGAFDGLVLHSSDYRTVADIDGDRVLVVGAGNSGCDLAVDSAAARLRTSISMRHGTVFQPKTYFGRSRSDLPTANWPAALQERALRALVRISVGRSKHYPGLPAPTSTNLFKIRPIINSQLLHWIHHGRIDVVPGITAIEGKSVTFDDGQVREYDTILLATGFRTSFPFLDEPLDWDGNMPLRYAGATLTSDLANLYFLGLIAPAGAQWPVYEAQMELIADLRRLQANATEPLVRRYTELEKPMAELDLARPVWNKRFARTRQQTQRLLTNS